MDQTGRSTRGGGTVRRRALLGISALPAALAVAVGALGGAGAFTFGYGDGFSYLRDDPAACANCHVMQEHYDTWRRGGHAHVATCNDCHLPHQFVGKWLVKADNGFFHSAAFTLGDFDEPIRIKERNRRVTQRACVSCHDDVAHAMHSAPRDEEPLSCIHCHADVGHAGRGRGALRQ